MEARPKRRRTTRGDRQARARETGAYALDPPEKTSRFFGRQQELRELLAVVREPRLVCLWGPPGVGKSRLARELSFRAAAEHEGFAGATAIDLRGVSRERDVLARVAFVQDDSVARHSLVVLDGADDCLDVLARVLPRLRHAIPAASWVVTSCERGRFEGEWAFDVGPLAARNDEDDRLPGPAIELFVERARAALGRTALFDDVPEAARSIVNALDAVPLFIELAASALPALGLAPLCQCLGVDGGSDDAARGDGWGTPVRDDAIVRFLRTASAPRGARRGSALDRIERSVAGLSSDLRESLATLACFRGSFTVADAARVLDVDSLEAVQRIEALRDRSLLKGPSSVEPEARLANWSAVRSLALGAARPDQRGTAMAQVADRVLLVADQVVQTVEETGSRQALQALADRQADLTEVVDRALALGPDPVATARAARAAVALDVLRNTVDPAALSLRQVGGIIEQSAAAALEPRLVAAVLGARGRIRGLEDGGPVGMADVDAALALLGNETDEALRARLLLERGILHHRERALSLAEADYEAALAVAAPHDARTHARALGNLAAVSHDRGELERAAPAYERAIAIAGAVGDGRIEGIFSANLAIVDQERGALHTALKRYERAVSLLAGMGDRRLLAITLGNLGMLHHEEGRLDPAQQCHERATEALARTGDRSSLALSRARLASVLASQDRIEEARINIERGLRVGPSGHAHTATGACLTLAEAFVDVALARRAVLERRDQEIAARLEAAQRRMAGVHELRAADGQGLASGYDDLRSLMRILARNLEASSLELSPGREHALLVAPDARWFRAPGGAWHDLRDRHAARRILERLCDAQRDPDCEGLGVESLKDAGWPGERILPAAAKNRVYVVLNQLRESGLRPWLLRTGRGWSLDPSLSVHRVSFEPLADATPPTNSQQGRRR